VRIPQLATHVLMQVTSPFMHAWKVTLAKVLWHFDLVLGKGHFLEKEIKVNSQKHSKKFQHLVSFHFSSRFHFGSQ